VQASTHNAIYFMYGAYFIAGHALYLFVLLFTVLEALFSKEEGGAATKTICQRASSFLGSQHRCTYSDIERLYNIRSELVHGRRKFSASHENLEDAHELEFVVTECMKKMLAERAYLKYKDVAEKENYFDLLTSTS
jgi:Apea-like HEPN